jgi:hypothetical protein
MQAQAILFNATDESISVAVLHGEEEIKTTTIDPGKSKKLDVWLFFDVRIHYKGQQLRYSPTDPGRGYITSSGFGPFTKRRILVKFLSDRKIYIVTSRDHFDGRALPQPLGYPLDAV